MTNILTVDLEDWHQLTARRVTGKLSAPGGRVSRQLEVLLGILADAQTQATFFVMGMLAEETPELVKRVAAAGHEIALHGYAHLLVNRLSRQQFEDDTRRGRQVLEEIIGEPVLGYRAAEFSIGAGSLWALEALAEMGFAYDSSVFPARRRRYGIDGFPPAPARYELGNGRSIVEIPPRTGGGYFRLAPRWLIRRHIHRTQAEQLPMVSYCHPYEFDPQGLKLSDGIPAVGWRWLRAAQFSFHQNLRRRSVKDKLAAMLSEFRFASCREYLSEAALDDHRALLSAAR